MPVLNPVSACDTAVAVPPVTGDSAALTVVAPFKFDAVPYSNDTVVEARFAFTEPVSVAVVVPIGVAVAPLTVGGDLNVKASVEVTVPPEPTSTTLTTPTAFAGVTTVTDVSLTLAIDVPAVPPNVTDDVPVKWVPVIVTVVPPDEDPVAGETEVIVGTPT